MKGLILASLIVGPPPVPVTPPPPPPPPTLGVVLGEPGFGGSGCPDGQMAMVLGTDQQSASLSFGAYTAAAGDRKTCNLAIPVHVPAGVQIQILGVEFKGTANLPDGAKATIRVESFFAGTKGPTVDKVIDGPSTDGFVVTLEPSGEAAEWSACGADVNLRINSSLRVTSTATAAASIVSASLPAFTARSCS
jgi:hypothetical protein